jgi:hypothetical protein
VRKMRPGLMPDPDTLARSRMFFTWCVGVIVCVCGGGGDCVIMIVCVCKGVVRKEIRMWLVEWSKRSFCWSTRLAGRRPSQFPQPPFLLLTYLLQLDLIRRSCLRRRRRRRRSSLLRPVHRPSAVVFDESGERTDGSIKCQSLYTRRHNNARRAPARRALLFEGMDRR